MNAIKLLVAYKSFEIDLSTKRWLAYIFFVALSAHEEIVHLCE